MVWRACGRRGDARAGVRLAREKCELYRQLIRGHAMEITRMGDANRDATR